MKLNYPHLVLPRCQVLQFSEELLTEKYVAWLNDIDVVRYSEQRHRRHTLESCRAYFDSQSNSNGFYLAIIAKDPTLGHIGNMGVTWDAPNGVADISILIGDKRTWRLGYGSEAWLGLMEYLKSLNEVRKITAGTMSANLGMRNLMLRSGMQIEGSRKAHLLLQGQPVDLIFSAYLKEDS
jgi:[ribosomal protein S5]-alanine N-acetyltransferase